MLPKGWGIHQSWGDPEDDPAGVRLEFLRDSLPGSALRPSFEVASFEKKGWRRLGPGPGGTFWISDLRFSGKADRQPLDGAAEVDLRESMLPKLEATLREALRE